jgi:hypothetical protein
MASVGVTVPEKMNIFYNYSQKIGQNQKLAIITACSIETNKQW